MSERTRSERIIGCTAAPEHHTAEFFGICAATGEVSRKKKTKRKKKKERALQV